MLKKISFYVTGKVHNVMFRQTFIRAALNRNLSGGVSNDAQDPHRVHCSLAGEEKAIDEMMRRLQENKPINSWGACVETLHCYDHFIEISAHQVTTDNVDQFHWSPNVEFYL